MFKNKLYVGYLLLALVHGCGTDDSLPDDGLPRLRFATPEETAKRMHKPGSYLVTFRTGLSPSRAFMSRLADERYQNVQAMQSAGFSDTRVQSIHFITAIDVAAPERTPQAQRRTTQSFGPQSLQMNWTRNDVEAKMGSIIEVNFTDEESAREIITQWDHQGKLWYAEPNYLSDTRQDSGTSNSIMETIASDYQTLSGTYWLSNIRLIEAFQLMAQRDKTKVSDSDLLNDPPIVAVMDSGVDIQHPDLQNRIWENPNPGKSGCGNDLNGCDTTVRDAGILGGPNVDPFETTHGNPCPETEGQSNCKHGTHVAGIVAAKRNNAEGVAGVCPICKIMVIKVVEEIEGQGRVPDSAILGGMKYISRFSREGGKDVLVRVVNSSLGKFQRSRNVALMVRLLAGLQGGGTLVVAAAGNEDTMRRQYPAALEGALAVAAVGPDGQKSDFSNFGPWVDIAAPGDNIVSTVPGGRHEPQSGTSMASPVVAGAAALLAAIEPGLSAAQLRARLIDSADAEIYSEGRNATHYIQKIEGQETWPLLGAGQLDVAFAYEGRQVGERLPAVLGRVSEGCSTIGRLASTSQPWWTLIILAAPLSLTCFPRKRRRQD